MLEVLLLLELLQMLKVNLWVVVKSHHSNVVGRDHLGSWLTNQISTEYKYTLVDLLSEDPLDFFNSPSHGGVEIVFDGVVGSADDIPLYLAPAQIEILPLGKNELDLLWTPGIP